MGRTYHPHPSLPLEGEGTEGRGSYVALLMRRSVGVSSQAMESYDYYAVYSSLKCFRIGRFQERMIRYRSKNGMYHAAVSACRASVSAVPARTGSTTALLSAELIA